MKRLLLVVPERLLLAIGLTGLFALAPAAWAQSPRGMGLSSHATYATPDMVAPPESRAPLSFQPVDRSIPIAPTSGAGLTISATFDSSITGNVNSTAIQNAINAAISVLQARFKDPITVFIYFRFASTDPTTGNPLNSGTLGQSYHFHYFSYAWTQYVTDLTADKTTANDTAALANLPATSLNASSNIEVSSANGRAVGESSMAPAMSATGVLGCPSGCIYDGIITLNSGASWSFTRPPGASAFDAQRTVEHEIDEILGLGSSIGNALSTNCPTVACYAPQDIWSYSSAGTRSILTSGSRYFSIDAGVTNIVGFNQTSGGDFGDWISGFCPQGAPYVQNAFSCAGQSSDVSATSPEGINLDVIGYDLVANVTGVSGVEAHATTTTNVQVSWSGSCSSTCHVYRSRSNDYTTFDLAGSSATSPFNDGGVTAGHAYIYKVKAFDGSSESADSNLDLAGVTNYTNAIVAGGTVKAVDTNDMRDAIDAVRTLYGIGAGFYTFGSGSPARVTSSDMVHKTDVDEMCTNLDTAVFGMLGTHPACTGTSITSNVTTIQAAHFNTIRNDMK